MHQCKLRANWLESSFVGKELRFLVGKKWDIIQQCVLVVEKAKSHLSWIRQSIASRSREIILHLCSALMRHTWSARFSAVVSSIREI